jgi:hypothetical protein
MPEVWQSERMAVEAALPDRRHGIPAALGSTVMPKRYKDKPPRKPETERLTPAPPGRKRPKLGPDRSPQRDPRKTPAKE